MWSAIRYVGSWVTLIAFICALAAWLYRSYLLRRERLIQSVPADKRARLVEQTFLLFKVDTAKLSPEHQYNLALKQISEQARRFHVTAGVIVVIAAIAGILTFVALPRVSPPPVPSPTPAPTPTPGNLSGEIEEVQVVGQGEAAQVFIRLSIKNTGSPTGAHQYSIHIGHASSRSINFKGPPAEINGRFTVPQADGKRTTVIQQKDSIVSKTQQAIGTGQKVDGWLRLALPLPADALRQPGIRYTVSFVDAMSATYQAGYEVR